MVSLLVPCASDMFMHFPPGSNNRLNGNQDNVRNAARLFDSQVTFGLEYINYWENDEPFFVLQYHQLSLFVNRITARLATMSETTQTPTRETISPSSDSCQWYGYSFLLAKRKNSLV